ncbi:hypothetical protein [Streptomyces sp. NPDC127197]|uniref:hypothetical protein n=1 Tax=Streptomyces sp. NPDC127197 TaxID=3345388 RepID=UPI00362CF5A4
MTQWVWESELFSGRQGTALMLSPYALKHTEAFLAFWNWYLAGSAPAGEVVIATVAIALQPTRSDVSSLRMKIFSRV